MNYQLEKSIKVIRNLPKHLGASHRRGRSRSVPLDSVINRCLNHIERINKITAVSKKEKEPILREAWEIYLSLQKYVAPNGERQHWDDRIREPLMDSAQFSELVDFGGLLEDGVMETSAPDLYAGGLGYRHVNWDAEYLMAVDGSERHHNPYWNPKEATVKPVKHFTKEEIEALNCPSR